jgi:CrcB protein
MTLIEKIAMVFVGGGLGSATRFMVYTAFARWVPFSRFPFATFTVNLFGSFVIAFVSHVALTTTIIGANTRLFLTVGVMGGLTTYSTFNQDVLDAMRSGQFATAALSVVATFVTCLLAGFLGFISARALVHG